jgi:hypothetical protein
VTQRGWLSTSRRNGPTITHSRNAGINTGATVSFSPDRRVALGQDDPTAASAEPPAGRPWRLVIGTTGREEMGDVIPVGTAVMVKTQYLGSWATGFVVAEHLEDGYLLQRRSDGAHLPGVVSRTDVRPQTDAD